MQTETIKTEKKAITLVEWFNGTSELLKLGFTEQEIEKAILDSGNSIDTLTEINGFSSFPTYYGRAEIVQERGFRYTKTTYLHQKGKEFESRETVSGMGIRVPAQYQGLKHGEILFALFSNKWNWFASFKKTETCEIKKFLSDLPISQIPVEFQHLTPSELRREYLLQKELKECSLWSIYEIRANDSEIYLETSEGSLYVPIKALTEKNFAIIEERMISYAGWYNDPTKLSGYALNHRGRTEDEYRKDKIADYNKMIAPLNSPEGLKLKGILS